MIDCNVLMLSVLTEKYSYYKTREKGCMAIIVCERVSDKIAFLLVREELNLAWQFPA